MRTPETKRPRVVNPRAFALPREIGVTDLREWKSVVWNEALVAFATQQAARSRAVAVGPQGSRVGDVEEGFHENSCVEKRSRSGEGRAPYAHVFVLATVIPTSGHRGS